MTRTERAIAGVAATGLGIAAGQLLGTVVDPKSAPLVAVGSAVIDLAPPQLKEWAVSTVGTADKPLLLLTVVVVVTALGAFAGIVSAARPLVADLIFAALGLVGVAAALTRSASGPADALPSIVAAVVAALVLRWQRGWAEPAGPRPDGTGFDRRLLLTGGAGILAALATAALPGSRTQLPPAGTPTITIPTPASTPPAFPEGLESTVVGVTPLRTPVPDFYRIDTALFLPQLDVAGWQLQVDGLVEEPFGHAELGAHLADPGVEVGAAERQPTVQRRVVAVGGIAVAGLVMVISYGVWLWHKASDLFSEFEMLGRRAEELADLVAQIQPELPARPEA